MKLKKNWVKIVLFVLGVVDVYKRQAVTQIKERQDEFKGIAVINDYIRQYDAPGLATHILGRTGKINAEEYEANKRCV